MTHTLKDKIREMEKEAILNALKECSWVQARAARQLGITERMIGYKIKKYGIEIKEVNNGEVKAGGLETHSQQNSNINSIKKKEI